MVSLEMVLNQPNQTEITYFNFIIRYTNEI